MQKPDEPTIKRIVELVTRQVLELLEQEKGSTGVPAPAQAVPGSGQAGHVEPARQAGSGVVALAPNATLDACSLASMIDHTLLKADATRDQILQLCAEARQYSFAAVCVNPSYVKLCAELLRGSNVRVCTVIGFPLGATSAKAKECEAQQAIADGATELDMVINIGALKSRDLGLVEQEIASLAGVCHAGDAILKVIIEAAMLTDEEKVIACELAKAAGADFVKTSTGFGPGGATAKDVALMRQTVGPTMGVKAAGGIRSLAEAQEMIAAGASRIGASASIKIIQAVGP